MGRPRNGVPYLKGGVYHVRFKGDDMSTDLGTANAGLAKSRIKEVVGMRGKRGISSISSPAVSISTSPSTGGMPSNVGSIGISAPTGTPLDDWYKGDSEFTPIEPSTTGVVSVPSGTSLSESQDLPTEQPEKSLSIDWQAKPGMPGLNSDEKVRLHGLLASVVGRVNVLGVGLGVRIFGRIPAEPEKEDMELLNKAWALQLNEIFADKEIKPSFLIAAASVGLGIGMYVNGEDKPKPPPKVIASQ